MSKQLFFESCQNLGTNVPPNYDEQGEQYPHKWRNSRSRYNPLYGEWQGMKFTLNGQPILTYNEAFMKRYRELEKIFG